MSLFQDTSIGIDNPLSKEEDEELEEQRRRQEELADLLATGIHAFNYDDSTMNSSVTSIETVESNNQLPVKNKNMLKYDDSGKSLLQKVSTNLSNAIEKNYKNANQNDQLTVLYEVRMREINALRDEFSKFREEKSKEINVLKNKVTLSEAESHHLQVTLTNSESLLVEKKDIIKNLKDDLSSRNQEVERLKKVIEQQNLEISTYSQTVNELQFKLADTNPFSMGARKLKSEELQKAHQDQIIKLETLLQEQTRKVQILEKEKARLEADIQKVVKDNGEFAEENNLTIMGLSKKLQSTQQQCKDLFLLGEAVKKESDHFKERMHQLEINKLDLSADGFQVKKMDNETMVVHIEKLKRMLLDKDIEINTLAAKLKFYDSDLNELFEYREMLSKMYSCEVKPCSNGEHEELLIFMQRQLQSYQQAVEDRNNQILSLNSVNKELQEKIEEMIQQTRTDIQKISQRYSLPQLETMSKELKNAQETIDIMKQQLMETDEIKKSAANTIRTLEQVQQENENLIQATVKDKHHLFELKQTLKSVEGDKNKLLSQLDDFKKTELQLMEENERVKTQLQKICLKLGLSEADVFESDADVHELTSLKSKYGRIHDQLQQVLVHLETVSPKKANFNIIFKLKKQIQNNLKSQNVHQMDRKEIGEQLEQWDNLLSDFIETLKHNPSYVKDSELKDGIEELTNAKTMLEGEKFALEYQLKSRSFELEEAKKEISLLNENRNSLLKESQNNACTLQKLNDQISNLKRCLQIVEENKLEVEKQLENTQKQLNDAKQETIDLHKEVSEVNENVVRKNLFEELKDVENVLEFDKTGGDLYSAEAFQKCLQAQILKAEIALRDRLQEENIKKMNKIEEQYKKVLNEKSDMYNKEKEKWKLQEANYRKQFAAVLEECGKKMEELEKENIILVKEVNAVIHEYKTFKSIALNRMEKYDKMVGDSKKSLENLNKQWVTLVEYYMINVTKIEKQGHKTTKSALKKMELHQRELRLIENMYEEKVRKFKAQNKQPQLNNEHGI